MAERSSLKPAPASLPTLSPQGTQAGKPAMPLGRPFTLLGSRNRAHLHLVSSTVSRNHACIVVTDNGLYIRDLASRSGVIVNGRRVKEADLRDGDTIQLGSFKFKFGDPAGPVRFPLTPKAASALLDIPGGAQTPIDSRTILIGRRATADIPVNDPSVSNTHAMIFEVNGQRFIRDLGSRTGTLVNGKPVHHQLLEFGDEIKIGNFQFHFVSASGQAQPQLQEAFEEPALDEDEPIGIDFSAEEPVVSASKNGEPAPIPMEDLDEAPLRLVPAAESTDEVPVTHDEPAEPTLDHVAPPADHHLTVPPAALAPADLGLDFLAEDPTHFAEQPVAQEQIKLAHDSEPAESVGLPTEASAIEEPPLQELEPEIPQIAQAGHTESEPVAAEAEPLPIEPEPEPIAQESSEESLIAEAPPESTVATAEPEAITVEPELEATPIPEVESIVTAAEPLEIEAELDQTTIVPAGQSTEDWPGETPSAAEAPAVEPPSQQVDLPIEDDIGLSPIVEAEAPPEVVETELQAEVEAPAEPVATVDEPALAPRVERVDLSSMRFDDERSAPELAPEAMEIPEAVETPKPLLDLPPKPVEEAPAPESESQVAQAEPVISAESIDIAPQAPAVLSEIPTAVSETPAPVIFESPVIAPAIPIAQTVLPVATVAATAVELASPTLEPPVPKKRGRPRGSRSKAAKTAPTDFEQNAPEVPAAETAAPKTPRRRGGRKKSADLAPEPPEEAGASAQPTVDSSSQTTETPSAIEQIMADDAVTSTETTGAAIPADIVMPAETSGFTASADAVIPVEASESSMLESVAPLETLEPPPSVEEPEAPIVEISEAPADASPVQYDEPSQLEEAPVRIDPVDAEDAEAPSEPHLTAESSEAANPETEPIQESIAVSETPESHFTPEPASDVEPALPPAFDVGEVLAPTDPTPESALDIEPALDQIDMPTTESAPVDSALTDTAFGQVVQEFSGTETGSLVEESTPLESAPQETAASDLEVPVAEEPIAAAEDHENAPAPERTTDHEVQPIADDEFLTRGPEHPTVASEDQPADAMSDASERESKDDFDFDVPEVDLTIDLSETPAERAVGVDLHDQTAVGPPPPIKPDLRFVRREAQVQPDDSLSSTEAIAPLRKPLFDSMPAATGDAPPQAPPPATNQLPPNVSVTPPPMNPFLGMSRDLGSFIGGMPLALGPAGRSAPAAPPAETTLPPSEPGALTFDDEGDPIPALDLSAHEEPLDLFDEAPEKLDAMPELGPASAHDGTLVPKIGGGQAPPQPFVQSRVQPQQPRVQGPAANPMRQVAPPPPPRTSPLRSFTGGPQIAAAPPEFPGDVSVTPPFGGAAGSPPQRLTGTPTREVDVFSNTAFPPLDPTMFGIAKRPTAPPPVRKQPAPPTEAELAELARTPRQQPVPNRPPPPKVIVAEPPPKRPWWKSLRILLPLMILAILVVIVIVVFFPPHHTVQGSLQLQGLNRDDVGVVRQTTGSLRSLIANAHVRQVAAANLRQENLSPGFLDDAEAVSGMTDSMTSPFDEARSQLQFRRTTRDVEGDKARMAALLAAIYAESGGANDEAARARGQVEQADSQLTDLDSRREVQDVLVKKLSEQVSGFAGPAARALLLNPRASLAQVMEDDEQLRQTLAQAEAQVERRREAFRYAQAKAAQSDGQAVAELRGVRQSIDDLTARRDAARLAQSGQIDETAKKFAAALDDFSGQLGSVPMDSGDARVSAYLSAARDAVDQVRQLNGQLTSRATQDSQAVEQLRREIANRRETHLRQVWASDLPLQQLLEQRNAESHQYNTAIDSGYSEEAAKIKGVMEDLDKKIDARRSALATGGPFADDLQQNLQTAIERMEADRQRDEQQMMQKLKLLEAPPNVPALAKLSATASTLIAARQTYGSASALSATEADAEARRLQSQIAEQQARLDTLRQSPSNQTALDGARNDLDASQAAEANASAAYTANHSTLSAIRQLADAKAAAIDLADRVQQKQSEIEVLKRTVAATPIIVKPDETSVSVLYAPDTRVQYLVAGVVAVLLLFAGPLWMSFSNHSEIPLANRMIESYDIPGHESDDLSSHDFDEEHPATA